MNKYRHKDYNPSFDHIFGRLLYEGLPEAAELMIENEIPQD